MELSVRDKARLEGVHPDLVAVVKYAYAICAVQPMVIEGVRTLAKQKEYVAAGKSRTMRSRHLNGHAVDLAPLVDLDGDGVKELSWNTRDFLPLASAMKAAGVALKIPIEWGGDWLSFPRCSPLSTSMEGISMNVPFIDRRTPSKSEMSVPGTLAVMITCMVALAALTPYLVIIPQSNLNLITQAQTTLWNGWLVVLGYYFGTTNPRDKLVIPTDKKDERPLKE